MITVLPEFFLAFERQAQLPLGTLSKIFMKTSVANGSLNRLELGEITVNEFAQEFSKECYDMVSTYRVLMK